MAKVTFAARQIIRSLAKTMTVSSARRKRSVGEIVLQRWAYHPTATLGLIEFADLEFWSVERPWLDNQPNISCIPVGEYKLRWRESPKFGPTWQLEDVPGRTHILIHSANFAYQLQGCIALGTDLMGDTIAVANSRKAMNLFEEVTEGGEWILKIKNAVYAAVS